MTLLLGALPGSQTLLGTDSDDRIVGVSYDEMVGGAPPDYTPGIVLPNFAILDGLAATRSQVVVGFSESDEHKTRVTAEDFLP